MKTQVRAILILAVLSAAVALILTLVVRRIENTNFVYSFIFFASILFAASYAATVGGGQSKQKPIRRNGERILRSRRVGRETVYRGLLYTGGMLLVSLAFAVLSLEVKGGLNRLSLNSDIIYDFGLIVFVLLVLGFGVAFLQKWHDSR